MNILKKFETIDELYLATEYYSKRSNIQFDIIDFSEIGSNTKRVVQPHRRDFYTIIFFENQKSGKIQLNTDFHNGLENVLLFNGPDHVFSFIRDENVSGFIILFQKEFLTDYFPLLDNEFPYFSIYNQNLFHLSKAELQSFKHIISSLFLERESSIVAKPLLAAFLHKSAELFNQYINEEKFISPKSLLVRRFKQLIGNHYTLSKNVEYYAELLSITAAYLNEITKAETGKTPKQLIMARILLEAKNLLVHTDLDIAQISHLLNFSEPTHFVRFFKKETEQTPNNYRNLKL